MMNGPSPADPWAYKVLGDQNFQDQRGFFSWWYRHTSMRDAQPGATFPQRDRVRRSRVASACLLFLATTLILVALIAILGPNKQIITVVYILYPVLFVCVLLNRRGFVNAVGILLPLGIVGGMCLTLLTTALRGGIAPNDKDILYLLFFAEVFAAAILPVNWVFLVAAINILFSLYVLSFAPHTPAFDAQLQTSYFSILFRLMQIHIIVPGVLWILGKKAEAAIQRANRAEELARLQHDLAQAASERAREKDALERSIATIIQTHMDIANGDLHARVRWTPGANVLWQIAEPLNKLAGRYQGAVLENQQRARMVHVFEHLMQQDPSLQMKVYQAIQPSNSVHPATPQ